MPRKANSNVNKSGLIRDYARTNPGVGPTELARIIEQSHGVRISTAMVSTVLSNDRNRGAGPVRRGRPPMNAASAQPVAAAPATSFPTAPAQQPAMVGGISLDTLIQFKQLADQVGGVDKARTALDTLSRILA